MDAIVAGAATDEVTDAVTVNVASAPEVLLAAVSVMSEVGMLTTGSVAAPVCA